MTVSLYAGAMARPGGSSSMSRDTPVLPRFGATCWLLTAAYFPVEPLVAAAWHTPYSFARNTISELGITECVASGGNAAAPVCSPLHAWMNGAFVGLGLLTLAGAVVLRRRWPARRLTVAVFALIVLASLSAVATGLAPENVDGTAHIAAAAPHFPAQNAAMILLGVAQWGSRRGEAVLALCCGGIGSAGLVLLLVTVELGMPTGAAERVALYPFTIWTAVVGALVWYRRSFTG